VTDRIYYTDPYATEFDATVISIEPVPADSPNGRSGAVLDRTAFYPTSGGQPFDVGRLGAARVVDVVDREDGTILHVVEGEIATGAVHGIVEWTRRFDHMQQHTGQHVLSAALDKLLGVRTVSFHLGTASSTIDLERTVSAEEIARAEQEANRVVWEDRPVTIRFADAEQAAALKLRKEPTREGTLRLIEVEDFDLSACGGTHVARTGAIGVIAVASTERFRGGTRIEFLCGIRALDGYRALRDSASASTRLLSVLPGEVPAAIERMLNEVKDQKREIKDLRARLGTHEAAALADRAETHGAVKLVVDALEGWDAGALKTIASAIAQRPGHLALLISTPAPAFIAIARAADVKVDCAAALGKLTAAFGGKGGGKPELVQGGGLQGSASEILDAARRIVRDAIGA
jgi:alanyl-tRNA synthetase